MCKTLEGKRVKLVSYPNPGVGENPKLGSVGTILSSGGSEQEMYPLVVAFDGAGHSNPLALHEVRYLNNKKVKL